MTGQDYLAVGALLVFGGFLAAIGFLGIHVQRLKAQEEENTRRKSLEKH
ncbi:MAG TPA: hypothetical protein VGF28_23605 [Thermoanaerobaculia bacterium]|jgi:hypothetical protein